MALADLAKPKTTGLRGLAGLAAPKFKADFSTIEGLQARAEQEGLGREAAKIADESNQLSFLQRLGKGLGAFNPAEALLTAQEKGIGSGLAKYVTGIAKGLGSAVIGKDIEGERRTFADIAEKAGIENKILKFGIGFIGDVLLDPTTYFGGAIAKGLIRTAKAGGSVALKGVGKVAPDVKTGLELVGTGLQEALGRAFDYGYKATKGAKEDVLTFLSKGQQAKLGLASSNLERLGTGILTPSQREELALKMIAGKRAEFAARELGEVAEKLPAISPDLAQEAKKYKSAEEFVKGQADKQIDELMKESGKGTIKLYHGTDVESANQIRQSGVFKSGENQPSFFTTSKKEALNYANNKSKFRGKKPEVIEIEVPKWAITKNNAGEIETHLNVPLYRDFANVFKPKDNELLKAFGKDSSQLTDFYNQVTRGITKTPAEIARETALKGASSEVAKVIEEQIARSKKFGEALDLENPYEVYFPFIKKDKLAKFMNETKSIRVGSEGYRKQFKNLLTNESMELDPAKAFFTRESQIVSDKMTRDFLSGFVKKYGRNLDDFKSVDDAVKQGYTLIKEKGSFGKELGYVNKYDGALIRDSISPEFQTVNMLAKATGFDAITSLFKRAVTGLFAPFHVRNFVSGNIQNFEVLGVDAFNPKNIAVGQKIAYLMGKGEKIPAGTLTLGGKTMKFSDIMKPFTDRFSGDTFYNTEFDLALKSGSELKQVAGILTKERALETAKTLGLGTEAIPFKIARGIGQFIEHQQKATAYITALGQGKNIDEALRLAEAAGFDYRALTRFESQILRRVIPFYSFTRKNLELQLKTLGENPERINQILSFFENISEATGLSDEDRQALPDYLRDSLVAGFGQDKFGKLLVAGGFGTPIEQPGQSIIGKGFGDTIRKIATSLNPIIKVPLEKAFGKDFFQDRPLKEVIDAKQYQILPEFIKDFIGFKEIEKKTKEGKTYSAYTADPEKLHILRNLPTTRLFAYLYDIYRPDLEGEARALNLLTAIKPKPIDLETVAYFRNRDKQRELEDLLIRAGILKQFTKTYVPK